MISRTLLSPLQAVQLCAGDRSSCNVRYWPKSDKLFKAYDEFRPWLIVGGFRSNCGTHIAVLMTSCKDFPGADGRYAHGYGYLYVPSGMRRAP